MKIGRHGRLQEWLEDYDDAAPGHRHISHLFALHPGDQISPRKTPELARAARVTLERRLAAGSGHTGWSRAWIINFWTRLLEGGSRARASRRPAHEVDDAEPVRRSSAVPDRRQLRRDRRGGRDAAPEPRGELAILPALPKAWPSGSIRGLRARGAIEVDVTWKAGRATDVRLRPDIDGVRVLRPPNGQRIASIKSGPAAVTLTAAADGTVRAALSRGREYVVAFADREP